MSKIAPSKRLEHFRHLETAHPLTDASQKEIENVTGGLIRGIKCVRDELNAILLPKVQSSCSSEGIYILVIHWDTPDTGPWTASRTCLGQKDVDIPPFSDCLHFYEKNWSHVTTL